MKNRDCSIVRDLLPLYVDDVISNDTKQFVDEHISDCISCKKEFELSQKEITTKDTSQTRNTDTEVIKKMKKKLTRKNLVVGITTAISVLVLTLMSVFIVFFYGIPASSDDVSIETEYQYSDLWYLNQDLVFTIELKDERAMFTSVEDIYETSSNGEEVWIGTVIDVRKSPISRQYQSTGHMFGCTIDENHIDVIKDKDFTVTFVFADKEITYSGLELGILEPQEDLKYMPE